MALHAALVPPAKMVKSPLRTKRMVIPTPLFLWSSPAGGHRCSARLFGLQRQAQDAVERD
eukprot:2535975-Prorocentrum_lima.AAC.1